MQTRERLLDVAGELLGEVGIERISTNMICARAGVTYMEIGRASCRERV